MTKSRMRSERDLFDFLLTHVRLAEGCRVWAGTINSRGYPRVMVAYKALPARRLLVQMLVGAYGETLEPTQTVYSRSGCNHPKTCMSLEHLLIGTRKQAVEAAKKRGAYQSGVARAISIAVGKAPRAKLSIHARHDVVRLRADGMTCRDIGARYGVPASAVSRAIRRWRAMGIATT
jgi:hypothetical protein